LCSYFYSQFYKKNAEFNYYHTIGEHVHHNKLAKLCIMMNSAIWIITLMFRDSGVMARSRYQINAVQVLDLVEAVWPQTR
jgi:hypothetical protein